MSQALGRGAIDTISLEVLAYLLEHLPQSQPDSDWIPGALLDSAMMQRLLANRFTGFAAFAFENEWLGGLLFYQGQALEAWRRALGGLENRAEAYRNLLPMLEFASVRFFVLPTSLIPCVAALTVTDRLESYDATKLSVAQMLTKLEQSQFAGAVILENGAVGQAWYFARGLALLEPTFPEAFREGRLHILHNPSQIPVDVVEVDRTETKQDDAAQVLHLQKAFEAVLLEHVGVNTKALLDANKAMLQQSNPRQLQESLEVWLEETYGSAFIGQFRQRLDN